MRSGGGGVAQVLAASAFGVDGGAGSVFGSAAGVQASFPAFPVQQLMMVPTKEGAVSQVRGAAVLPVVEVVRRAATRSAVTAGPGASASDSPKPWPVKG